MGFVLTELKKQRKFGADGSVYLTGGRDGAFGLQPWLRSALNLEVSNSYKNQLVRNVIFSVELSENFDEKLFCKALNKENERLRRSKSEYRVVFPIFGIPSYIELPESIQCRNTTISFHSKLDSIDYLKFVQEFREKQQKDHPNFFDDDCKSTLRECSYFTALCSAISAFEAQEVASMAVQIYLGMINFTLNAPKFSQWTIGGKAGSRALNDVLVGPHITVHMADGHPASEAFWYDPWVEPRNVSQKDNRQGTVLKKNLLHLIEIMESSKWREFAENTLIRYNQAFSESHHESALLAGWRVLEYAAGDRNSDFDRYIDRAANCTAYREEMIIAGQHLKYLRNSFAHGHISEVDESEAMVFELQRFLRPLLNQILFMRHGEIETKQDLWALLDLPESQEMRRELQYDAQRRLELHSVAQKFFRDETK